MYVRLCMYSCTFVNIYVLIYAYILNMYECVCVFVCMRVCV